MEEQQEFSNIHFFLHGIFIQGSTLFLKNNCKWNLKSCRNCIPLPADAASCSDFFTSINSEAAGKSASELLCLPCCSFVRELKTPKKLLGRQTPCLLFSSYRFPLLFGVEKAFFLVLRQAVHPGCSRGRKKGETSPLVMISHSSTPIANQSVVASQ